MAKADFELKISLEELLHKSMSDFAMKYYQEHGVMINCVKFDWIKTIDGKGHIFELKVETISNG